MGHRPSGVVDAIADDDDGDGDDEFIFDWWVLLLSRDKLLNHSVIIYPHWMRILRYGIKESNYYDALYYADGGGGALGRGRRLDCSISLEMARFHCNIICSW